MITRPGHAGPAGCATLKAAVRQQVARTVAALLCWCRGRRHGCVCIRWRRRRRHGCVCLRRCRGREHGGKAAING